ncbi:MAG: hypothetical protein H6673_14380 [Anaerolineales bacterium]|nr:hypothetical protein [Anaerolineales bacterium]
MRAVLVLMSAVLPVALMVMMLVLGELSRRLGAVLKKGQSHRWFYIAASLEIISVLVRILHIDRMEHETGDTTAALAYLIPLTLGIIIGLVITWRYWGWLVYASDGKTLTPTQKRK